MEKQMERIAEMEAALESCARATAELTAQLDRLDALRDTMLRLHRYYGSPEWYADRELSLPPGTKAGVLSEDQVYDEITDLRDAAFRMLELGTDILKNRI